MIRPYHDNVVLRLDPLATETASGIAIVQPTRSTAHSWRTARVAAVGPGHYQQAKVGADGTIDSLFLPTTVQPGDRVLIDSRAGQDYTWNTTAPRHNKASVFEDLLGEAGEFRIVREAEILAVCDPDAVIT